MMNPELIFHTCYNSASILLLFNNLRYLETLPQALARTTNLGLHTANFKLLSYEEMKYIKTMHAITDSLVSE